VTAAPLHRIPDSPDAPSHQPDSAPTSLSSADPAPEAPLQYAVGAMHDWTTDGAPELAAPEAGAPVLLGRYRLEVVVGRGDTASMFRATDLRLGRSVLVKLFAPAIAENPALEARFERSAARALRLSHPCLLPVLDAGFGEYGPFVVTSLAGPLTLRALLDQQGRLELRQAVRIAARLASALSYLHRQGIVHGAVRPENVLLTANGERVLLAHTLLSFEPPTRRDRAQLAYQPPEQRAGARAGRAADVYALGALLYEMLIGQRPATGAADEHRPVLGPRLFDPSIPPEVDAVVTRALEATPDGRWRSMHVFEAALLKLERAQLQPQHSGQAPALVQALSFEPTWPPRRPRRPTRLAVPLLGIAAALLLATTMLQPLLSQLPRLAPTTSQQPLAAPALVGQPIDQAAAQARAQGLQLVVLGRRLTDRMPEGTVVQQAPVAGFPIEPGATLRVTVSAGVQVPDVRGKRLAVAQWDLEALGWKIARVDTQTTPEALPGTILLQDPAPGEIVSAPGELAVVVAR